jgi:CRP/FNR family transcriptional regulator
MPEELIHKLQQKKPGQGDNISPTSNHIFLEPNSMIFHQGDPFHSIFMIKTGCVKTLSVSKNGDESLDGIYFPGEFIGLNSIAASFYSYYAVTASSSVLCKIPYRNLENVSSVEPTLTTHFIGAVSKQLSREIIWRKFITKSKMKERLIGFLLDISDRFELESGPVDKFKLPISLQEISYLLDMRNETLSRQIKGLNKEGFININKGTITIIDRFALDSMLDKKFALAELNKKNGI